MQNDENSMNRIISDKITVARKRYRCDASERWLESGYTLDDCESGDQRLMVEAAMADRWHILPGQAYRKVVGVQDNELCVYRARPGMDKVCFDLDMWGE